MVLWDDEAVGERVGHRLGPRCDAELAEHARDVTLDRALAKPEASAAICWFERPRASTPSTSLSRWVSTPAAAGPRRRRVSRLESAWSSTNTPSATVRTALTSSLVVAVFSR